MTGTAEVTETDDIDVDQVFRTTAGTQNILEAHARCGRRLLRVACTIYLRVIQFL